MPRTTKPEAVRTTSAALCIAVLTGTMATIACRQPQPPEPSASFESKTAPLASGERGGDDLATRATSMERQMEALQRRIADASAPDPGMVGVSASAGDLRLGGGNPPSPTEHQASVKGPFANVTVQAVGHIEGEDESSLAGLRPKLKHCYTLGLEVDPNMRGELLVRVQVSGAGVEVTTESRTGLSPSVEECMLRSLKRGVLKAPQARSFEVRSTATKSDP